MDSQADDWADAPSDPTYGCPGPRQTRSTVSGARVTPPSGSSFGVGKSHAVRQMTRIGVAHTVATSPLPAAVALMVRHADGWIHNQVGKFTMVASPNSSIDEGEVEMTGIGSRAPASASWISGGSSETGGSGTVSQKIHRCITFPLGILAGGSPDWTASPVG